MLNHEEYEAIRARLIKQMATKPDDITTNSVRALYSLVEAAENHGVVMGRSEMARDNAVSLAKVLNKHGIETAKNDSRGFGDYLCALENFLSNEKEKGEGINVGVVKPFPNVKPTKEQALKVIEEAAEVFGAWQEYEEGSNGLDELNSLNKALIDECSDVIQAVCNLVNALGVDDLEQYMQACEKRNRDRGRYDA